MTRLLTLLVFLLNALALPSISNGAEISALPKLEPLRVIPSPQGGVTYMSKASISELNQYYKSNLTKAGWAIKDEQTDDKSFGNATLIRDGEYLALMMGGNPAGKPPTVMVSLKPIGKISSEELPYYKPSDTLYASPATSMYVTQDTVASVSDATQQLLEKSGWTTKKRSGNEKSQFLQLTKNGSMLTATVQMAPAQGNKTTIQYGVAKAR